MFNKTIEIDGSKIGNNYPPYIIAEMSANHGNNINIAIESIKKAKEVGANAVKIQTYTADTLTLDCKEKWFEAKGSWRGQYLYDLYRDASMPWEWTPKLLEVAKEIGITLFSSPFDFSAVDFLEDLDFPAYKIASVELIDLPLIKRMARTQKPIIMSTGNATIAQIHEACETILNEDNNNIAILKCTSEYPADPKDINLKTIPYLKELFKVPVGLSDHTLGSAIPIASIAMGGNIIEKHFILDRAIKTADSFFSATPDELKAIVDGSKMVHDALGDVCFPLTTNPSQRSLIAIKDIAKGQKLVNGENFKSLRPGGGIEPKYLDLVNNRTAIKAIKKGTLLNWELIS